MWAETRGRTTCNDVSLLYRSSSADDRRRRHVPSAADQQGSNNGAHHLTAASIDPVPGPRKTRGTRRWRIPSPPLCVRVAAHRHMACSAVISEPPPTRNLLKRNDHEGCQGRVHGRTGGGVDRRYGTDHRGCHGPVVVGAAVSPGDRTTLRGVRRGTRRWANGEAVRCWLWNRLQRLPDVAELT